MPICVPSSSINRISRTRILSLTRTDFSMAHLRLNVEFDSRLPASRWNGKVVHRFDLIMPLMKPQFYYRLGTLFAATGSIDGHTDFTTGHGLVGALGGKSPALNEIGGLLDEGREAHCPLVAVGSIPNR